MYFSGKLLKCLDIRSREDYIRLTLVRSRCFLQHFQLFLLRRISQFDVKKKVIKLHFWQWIGSLDFA